MPERWFDRLSRRLKRWLQRIPLLRTGMAYLAVVNAAPEGVDDLGEASYTVWRDRFLLVRLRLTLVLALCIWASFLILPIARTLVRRDRLDTEQLIVGMAVTASLGLTWRLTLTPWGIRHLRPMFLGLVGSLQLLPQALHALLAGLTSSHNLPDFYNWIFIFFAQATLIPVRWRLHVTSQILVVGFSYGLRELGGFSLRSSVEQSRAVLLLTLFWICLVCDLSVFLYERLQRAEFDARYKLSQANRNLATAEAEIRNALESEKELSQLKSRFVSMTSHEFRTPLTTILSSSEALQHYGDRWSDEKRQAYFQRIRNTVQHMNRLLEDVLAIGRADSGRVVIQPVAIDIEAFCRSLVEELELGIQAHHQIKLWVGPRPGPELPAWVWLDEGLLRQILGNLLGNAIKYSPTGGEICFELTYPSPNELVFQVSDQGIGIPPEELPRLFESFHRANNVGTLPGTGLGLAIVKRAVQACGGEISVASEPGVGTTFKVRLPWQVPPN